MSLKDDDISIRIRRDGRNFADQQRDTLRRMEEKVRIRTDDWPFSDTGWDDKWTSELSRKMDERRKQWEQEIARKREEFFQLKPLTPRVDGFSLNQTDTKYERGSDGRLHFRVRFDVSAFSPDDLRVTTTPDRRLKVTAKHTDSVTPNSSSTREFSRTLDLPRGTMEDDLTCSLTTDGILIVDAPLDRSPFRLASSVSPYSTLSTSSGYFPHDKDDASFPLSDNSRSSTITRSSHTNRTQSQGDDDDTTIDDSVLVTTSSPPSMWSNNDDNSYKQDFSSLASSTQQLEPGKTNDIIRSERKFYLDVELGDDYLADEIDIRTQNNKIYIRARHEEKTATRSCFREFTKEYDIPHNVDPYSIAARLENGILHVEAPYKS